MIDILVNNTGINPLFGPLMDADLGAFRKIFDTNVVAGLGFIQEAFRAGMSQRGGAVVNIASVAGIRSTGVIAAYGASKAALIRLTAELAWELGPQQIRVNAIAPAIVKTKFAEALYATAAEWSHDLTGTGGTASRPAEVWDLFCGVGGFGLALADQGRQVRGVEVSAPAIDGAREAARLMGLRPGEVDFAAGDARVLDPAAGAVRDLLVVNPPRRGIGADLAGRIEASGTPRVLYSSCNPVSLAKDLARMPSLRVRRARLFDMFPHTEHAEVLVELVRD